MEVLVLSRSASEVFHRPHGPRIRTECHWPALQRLQVQQSRVKYRRQNLTFADSSAASLRFTWLCDVVLLVLVPGPREDDPGSAFTSDASSVECYQRLVYLSTQCPCEQRRDV